jgi:prepilin-type N-terminal cleavage/methylation domain-containing protein
MRNGFTLVELLVVITIIVLLLAMLAPALDRAIYAAELARCGGQMKGVTSGVTSYAMGHNRQYPYREGVRHPQNTNYQIKQMSGSPNQSGTLGFDERPMLRPWVNLDAYVCPPAGSISVSRSEAETILFLPFQMFYGYQWRGAGGGQGMFKLGDTITYNGHRFSTMVSDHMATGVFLAPFIDASAHPDSLGLLTHGQQQDQPASAAFIALAVDPDAKVTVAGWGGTPTPGMRFEMNFGFTDGAVVRISDMSWNVPNYGMAAGANQDERFRRVPFNVASPSDPNIVETYSPIPRNP